ncbi:MAG: 4Fe-4S binding protein [Candidatus Hydrogenedentota bacterium]
MQIAVASGKGGTGKTTVATNLAWVAREGTKSIGYIDCDVEEPNGAIFLKPHIEHKQPVNVAVPEVDTETCNGCGLCARVCEYGAIAVVNRKAVVFPELCHGCRGCQLVCPKNAITESFRQTGWIEEGKAEGVSFVQGMLNVGEAMSPPAISAAKESAPETDLVILDAPPGTSCPVIETVRDADFVLLVTEPTPFGLNDLKLAIEMVRAIGLPFGVVVNRAHIGGQDIELYCAKEGITVLGGIPDDYRVAEAYSRGELLVEAIPEYKRFFTQLWKEIERHRQAGKPLTPARFSYTSAQPLQNAPDSVRIQQEEESGCGRSHDAKELVVISGKGGTGKTSILASFASLTENAVLADCDVDAADLHMLLQPSIQRRAYFSGGKRARIDSEQCNACGVCQDVCQFSAIHWDGPPNKLVDTTFRVDPLACEGCGVCVWSCPAEAIAFEPAVNGEWFVSGTRFGPMVHAKLGVAEENSGKLVSLIRDKAKETANAADRDLILIDGSPGIGCPVIASITGADAVLIVTEPTLSGKHDLERIAGLAAHFRLPALVCVNKWDMNPDVTREIEQMAVSHGLALAGRVRYDRRVTEALINGQTVVEHSDEGCADDIRALWEHVETSVYRLHRAARS